MAGAEKAVKVETAFQLRTQWQSGTAHASAVEGQELHPVSKVRCARDFSVNFCRFFKQVIRHVSASIAIRWVYKAHPIAFHPARIIKSCILIHHVRVVRLNIEIEHRDRDTLCDCRD